MARQPQALKELLLDDVQSQEFGEVWIEYTVPKSSLVIHEVFPPSGNGPKLALGVLRIFVARSIWQDGGAE
jgi:hypothetical protein